MRLAATAFAVVLLFVARLPGQTPAAKNAQDAGARETVEFNRDIRPLLSDKCYTCHGPDQARRRTKLRFDVEPTPNRTSADASPSCPAMSRRAKSFGGLPPPIQPGACRRCLQGAR